MAEQAALNRHAVGSNPTGCTIGVKCYGCTRGLGPRGKGSIPFSPTMIIDRLDIGASEVLIDAHVASNHKEWERYPPEAPRMRSPTGSGNRPRSGNMQVRILPHLPCTRGLIGKQLFYTE